VRKGWVSVPPARGDRPGRSSACHAALSCQPVGVVPRPVRTSISTIVPGGTTVPPGTPGFPFPTTTPPPSRISGNALDWFGVNGAVADDFASTSFRVVPSRVTKSTRGGPRGPRRPPAPGGALPLHGPGQAEPPGGRGHGGGALRGEGARLAGHGGQVGAEDEPVARRGLRRRAGRPPVRALRARGRDGLDGGEEGSRFVERMLTVCESLRAQGRSILDFLEESIRAGLCGQPHPSLLPARAA
jgi:hypothetical protein